MKPAAKTFCKGAQITIPVIAGAMYPCSNPELVAAVSENGGLGMVQPLSLTYVHGYDFRQGLRRIREMTDKPIGLNLILEKSSKRYAKRTADWLDIALDEGIRFFVTALGNPSSVSQRIHERGGLVYHNTTNHKWAEKAVAGDVDGLICVNNHAGGHAGTESATQLYESLKDLGKPLICAGGISKPEDVLAMIDLGYAGIQMGTRFIASAECTAHPEYKKTILTSQAEDIVLTDKLSGVPVSVINTDFVRGVGTRAGGFARWMLRGSKTKKYMRMFYTLRSFRSLKGTVGKDDPYQHYLQAGKSVSGIESILSVSEIMKQYAALWTKDA